MSYCVPPTSPLSWTWTSAATPFLWPLELVFQAGPGLSSSSSLFQDSQRLWPLSRGGVRFQGVRQGHRPSYSCAVAKGRCGDAHHLLPRLPGQSLARPVVSRSRLTAVRISQAGMPKLLECAPSPKPQGCVRLLPDSWCPVARVPDPKSHRGAHSPSPGASEPFAASTGSAPGSCV